MDLVRLFDACLHSLWLLPVLAVMIAADGPVPVLPSETVLMSAAAAAFGIHDVRGIIGLFAVALVGSVAGDLLTFWLGRSSNRLPAGRCPRRLRPGAVGQGEPLPPSLSSLSSAPGCCPAGGW